MDEVWVIDDDPFAAKLTKSQFAQCLPQARVSVQTNPIESWHTLAKNRGRSVDLIVLDLRMPDMDGITYVRNLANISYPGKLIFCSGQNDRMLSAAQQIAEDQGLNILGSVQKPTRIEAVKQLLQNGRISPQRSQPEVSANDIERGIQLGEFFVEYQPKVCLHDASLRGVEVLARWKHQGRLIAPDGFIAVAEHQGLIESLTNSVIERSLAETSSWLNRHQRMQIAINLSVDALKDLALPDRLERLCKQSHIAPDNVILELTESRLIARGTPSLDILSRLHLKGFTLALDDYGAGHSTLTQLSQLPFCELKLDRSFVTGVADSASRQAIVRNSVQLAKELDMHIVAEGVESQHDWDFVAEVGCDLAQGFFIAKPMPAKAIEVWAELWQEKSGR